jgi:DNA-binding ferritin-like protein
VRKVVENQIAEGNTKAAQLVEFATRNAPVGSEPLVSLFRNAVAACNSAYDNFSRAARQAFDAAESNMDNATQAAVNAVTPEVEVTKTRTKKGE